ncbi:MAG: cytochrome P450 [Myxococcales bacterium]|nr:cytochrome P450 [Myxococcales bacterium]
MPRTPPRRYSPYGLPLVGHTLAFRRDPLNFMLRMTRELGDVAPAQIGPAKLLFLSRPEHVRRVLMHKDGNLSKRTPVYRALARFLGRGILTSEGDFWLRHRRIIQPMFSKQRLARFASVMTRAIEDMLARRWRDAIARGDAFDIADEMTKLTLRIVVETLLGSSSTQDMEDLDQATESAQRYVQTRIGNVLVAPRWLPTAINRAATRGDATLDRIAYALIDDRLSGQVEGGDDLLSALVSARDDEGRPMSRQQIRDEVVTLLVAGHETTANALAWAFMLLSRAPDVIARAREELARELAGATPDAANIRRLAYLRAVVSESLRLYPPVWVTGRLVLEPTRFGDVTARVGDVVLVSPWISHRRADFWTNPEGFDPARWMTGERPAPYTYFPFGGGPHKCIGDAFGLLEIMLVLATLLPRVQLDLVPGEPIIPDPMITLKPRGGVWVRARAVG